MPPKGSVLCFMCRAALRCEAGDLSKYRRHMKVNHQVIIEQQILLPDIDLVIGVICIIFLEFLFIPDHF